MMFRSAAHELIAAAMLAGYPASADDHGPDKPAALAEAAQVSFVRPDVQAFLDRFGGASTPGAEPGTVGDDP